MQRVGVGVFCFQVACNSEVLSVILFISAHYLEDELINFDQMIETDKKNVLSIHYNYALD